MAQVTQTIAAIATAVAPGGIGMVRLSGDQACEIAAKVFRPKGTRTLAAAKGYSALYGRVADAQGEEFDEAIAFVYRAPKSYTGEEVVELSCHGGVYVVQRLYRACLDAGAMPAQAGEFTKRAFLNGKISLTQAEGVADLIASQGAQWNRVALEARDGAVYRSIRQVSDALAAAVAQFSAWVDYPDDEIEELDAHTLRDTLYRQRGVLDSLLERYDTGRIYREGVATAIVGRPNVGKSTLMNLLAGIQRSIVTDVPGTTRDIVEETVRLGEVVLRLADTAGLRETDDPVEQAGVGLARHRMEQSQLILAVFDSSDPLSSEDMALLESLKGRPAVGILNKTDLPRRTRAEELRPWLDRVVELSASRGEGTGALQQAIFQVLQLDRLDGFATVLINERQRQCVQRSRTALTQAIEALESGMTYDAVSVCVEESMEALLELTGERASDRVVEEIFSRFCVGK